MPQFPGYGGGGSFGANYGMPGGGSTGNMPMLMELIRRHAGGQGAAPGGFPAGAMVPAGGAARRPSPMMRMPGYGGMPGTMPGAGGFPGSTPAPGTGGGGGAGESDWRQLLAQLVEGGGKGGAFDPMGSSPLLEMLRRTMISDAGARQRSNQLGAQSRGVDPSQSGYLSLLGDIQGQSDLSRSLSGAQTQSALQNQKFIQELLSTRLAQLYQRMPKEQSGTDFGGLLGGIGGLFGAL